MHSVEHTMIAHYNMSVVFRLGSAGFNRIFKKVAKKDGNVNFRDIKFCRDISIYRKYDVIILGLLCKVEQQEVYCIVLAVDNRTVVRE